MLYRLGDAARGIGAQVEVLLPGRRGDRGGHAAAGEDWPSCRSLLDRGQLAGERGATTIYRTLLGDLLAPPEATRRPPTCSRCIKTKEVVETLEEAADAFETVANTVESIAVKES